MRCGVWTVTVVFTPPHTYALFLGTAAEIEHFSFDCPPEDKLIVTMALLKLGLVKKKVSAMAKDQN